MTRLVELGAIRLIEMGDVRTGQTIPSPVVHLFNLVDYIEDPLKGTLEEGDEVSAQERALSERLRTISRIRRRALVSPESLSGLGYSNVEEEIEELSSSLNAIVLSGWSLGKKKKHGFARLHAKIMKVVKSPVFLTVLGVVANIIPGVGQLASAALLAAASARAAYEQKAKQQKAIKKEQAAAAAEAAQGDQQQLDAYYQQYHAEYLDPLGYTSDVWAKFSNDQKRSILTKLSQGTLTGYVSPAQQAQMDAQAKKQMAQTAALSIAVKKVYGNQVQGQGLDVSQLPPDVQAEAQALAPQVEQQINAVGKDNFMATMQKAVGQAAALSDAAEGAGSELPGGMTTILKGVDPKVKAMGLDDLKNSGAATGSLDTVQKLVEPSGFPWGTVGAVGGGVAGVGLVLYLLFG